MSAPRAPRNSDQILSVANYLRDEGPDWDDAREVADMLEDIANGKWTLTNEQYARERRREFRS